MKQDFAAYFSHCQHLISDSIHRKEGMNEASTVCLFCVDRQAKEYVGSIVVKTLVCPWLGIEPQTSVVEADIEILSVKSNGSV